MGKVPDGGSFANAATFINDGGWVDKNIGHYAKFSQIYKKIGSDTENY